jgi:transketolase
MTSSRSSSVAQRGTDVNDQQPDERLKEISWRLSRKIIEITTEAGSGHPSSSLSAIDILTVLYFDGVLRYDPKKAGWPERDRFIMSKGHAAPGLYVTLAEAAYFSADLLPTLRNIDSPLEGHPVMNSVPGIEASTGSLGQGLSIGLGHALSAQIDRKTFRVYVMIGDGESDEGQIWEAAMAAAKFNVSSLTAILDHNQYQQTGPVQKVMPSLSPVIDKWQAFGWKALEINGHDFQEIQQAFAEAQQVQGRPQVIIAHTDKGKGLSPFTKDEKIRKHGVALTPDEAKIALDELDRQYRR